MAKSKLKSALDREKGVNYKLEKQKKLQKAAEKRKKQKAPAPAEDEHDDLDVDDADHVDFAEGSDLEIDEFGSDDDAKSIPKEEVAAKLAELKEKVNGQADGWETDESEAAEEEVDDDDDDDDEEEEAGEDEVNNGVQIALDDESDSDSEDEDAPTLVSKISKQANGTTADEESDEDNEDDIPMSDIESLASEDRADVVPHQRLTINNTAALQRSLKSFILPDTLPFSAVQAVTSAEPVAIADVDDDLNRELAFYRQSLNAVTEARSRLKKEGVPFSRPTDYFAEMVKSEEQMGKVREKMLDEAARKKASADARRQRDLKKFGKAVQVAKLQERQKEKRETLDRINTLKRKRQGADLTAKEDDMFDVALEDAAETAKQDRAVRRAKGGENGPNRKRQKKDAKFGFGGKKRFAKSNDAKSAGDMSGYSAKRMKGGKPGKQRPGKSKRARM